MSILSSFTPTGPDAAANQDLSESARASCIATLVAAALFSVGYFVPFLSASEYFDEDAKLSQGGAGLGWAYLGSVALMTVFALVALKGTAWCSKVAAGVGMPLAFLAFFFLITFQRSVSASEGAYQYAIGYFLVLAAVVVAWAACYLSFKDIRTTPAGPFNTGVLIAGAASFLGVPLALLTESNGSSVWDVPDGWIQFGFVLLAIVPGGLAAAGFLKKNEPGIGLAIGVSVGFGCIALGAHAGGSDGGSSNPVMQSNQAIFDLAVIAAFVLGVVALRVRPGSGAGTPSWSGAAGPSTPPQWASDPFLRHEFRYWDGRNWTGTVSDQGVVSTDAPIPPPPPGAVPTSAPAPVPPPAPAPVPPTPPTSALAPPPPPAASPSNEVSGRPTLHVDRAPASRESNADAADEPDAAPTRLDEI